MLEKVILQKKQQQPGRSKLPTLIMKLKIILFIAASGAGNTEANKTNRAFLMQRGNTVTVETALLKRPQMLNR